MFLRPNSTIKSYDGGKGGYICNFWKMSIHLHLTYASLSGQLSLYLLNDFKNLSSELTKGIIALTVWDL